MKTKKTGSLRTALICIAVYVAVMSAFNTLNANGLNLNWRLLPAGALLAGLLLLLRRTSGFARCGFIPIRNSPRCAALRLLPLIALSTANLWRGFCPRLDAAGTTLYILSMLCIGFTEEILFRGLLLRAMLEEGTVRAAVLVSSLTFGLGHIVNLISGAELLPTLLQLVYACAIGFMLSMLVLKTGNILPGCLFHGVFNALSCFANEAGLTTPQRLLQSGIITVVAVGYALYLLRGRREMPE